MYILLAILMFGFLIFIHELGHFLSAKLLDVQVNEFAICMGPVLWQKKKGETTYSLRAIPIGGFCAMEGEDEESDNPRAFPQKSWWRRLIILAAGSFMNFVAGFLAIVLLYTGASAYSAPIVTDFFEGCPLESADGLQAGDELYKIDGRRVYLYSDVGMLLSRNKTGVYDVVVKRSGSLVELHEFEMKPQLYMVDGQQAYKYGLYFGTVPGGFSNCLKYSWYTAMDFARLVWMSLEDLVSGLVSVSDMSGPVGIVSTISEVGSQSATVQAGLQNVAYLGAFIAINLAVMNMLPLPALDGGRIFLLLVNSLFTAITKKKIPAKYEAYVHAAGMVLLLGFMAFVTFKDIWKLFT
jgi:regulator of sigma E protease